MSAPACFHLDGRSPDGFRSRNNARLPGGARTGELIRDIVGLQADDSFHALSFGDRLESTISLERLPDVTLEELSNLSPHFGKAELRILLSAVELGRRVSEAKQATRVTARLSSSQAAIAYCKERFSRLIEDGVQEEFHVVTLGTKNQVLNSHLVTVGTLDASLVHPREVFRPAIRDAASSILAVHNHPSGDPTPSPQDISVTERLESCGKTLGIDVLDHIIVARHGSKSIREER